MKRKLVMTVLLTAMLALTACGSGKTPENSVQTEEAEAQDEKSTDSRAENDAEDITAQPEENVITELTVNTAVKISGRTFTLKTDAVYPEDDEILAITAVYGDQELKIDEALRVDSVYAVAQDGQEYVLAETSTYNDYQMVYLLKLDEGHVTLAFSQQGGMQNLPTDPTKGIEIVSKVDVLGTYGGLRTYHIKDDRLTPDITSYQFTGGPDGTLPELTVKGSIVCRIEGGNTTLKSGDVIIPQAYSPDDGTFYFELPDGTAGNFLVDLSYDGSEDQMTYSGTIGGVDEADLFESLPYAG